MKKDLQYLYDSLLAGYKHIENKTDWLWFRNLWERGASEEDYYKLAQTIIRYISWERFDDAWQYCTINHESYKQAKIEWVNALLGWY